MDYRDKLLEELVERSIEYRYCPFDEVIKKEHLEEYQLGLVDIIYADSINFAVVPCNEHMIIAHEHVDKDTHEIVAEYAIYSQHDRQGENLRNSLNMDADYVLEYIGEETFTNMAFAIAYAANLIDKGLGGE